MSTYAIGDLQGCLTPLQRLLDKLRFDPTRDRLWFAGDLVNRGPDSAGCLRFVRSLGDCAVTVLGNHDLHLLAVAAGGRRGRTDTFDDVLEAPDAAELLNWLRRRPLLHRDTTLGWTLVHAGLCASWTLDDASRLADEAQARIGSDDQLQSLTALYGNEPRHWRDAVTADERLRFTVNCLTRLRYCSADGGLCLEPKGSPGTQPAGAIPWFEAPGRQSAGERIVFGHWSTLGHVHWPQAAVWGIDTGCLWGGRLTALCLETAQLVDCDCPKSRHPG